MGAPRPRAADARPSATSCSPRRNVPNAKPRRRRGREDWRVRGRRASPRLGAWGKGPVRPTAPRPACAAPSDAGGAIQERPPAPPGGSWRSGAPVTPFGCHPRCYERRSARPLLARRADLVVGPPDAVGVPAIAGLLLRLGLAAGLAPPSIADAAALCAQPAASRRDAGSSTAAASRLGVCAPFVLNCVADVPSHVPQVFCSVALHCDLVGQLQTREVTKVGLI